MKVNRLATSFICAVLFAWPFGGRAELVKGADARFGPDSLTLDTRTGLAWLNLPLTVGLSYDMAKAATQPGGQFSGFRLAKADEVITLYRSAGLPGAAWYPEGGLFDGSINSLLSLVGATSYQDGRPEAFGISDTSTNPGSHLVPGLDCSFASPIYGYSLTGAVPGTLAYGDTTAESTIGVWLVTPIPEPCPLAFWVVGIALFGLRSVRLRARRL